MLLAELRSQGRIVMPAPLHVSDELSKLVSTHLQPRKQARVVYSHWFSPEADSSRTNLAHRPSRNDLYQDWMRVRVPELQSAGRSWTEAIETSRAESTAGSSVVVLPISKLPTPFNNIH